ncbi:mitochondrial export translocase protein [Apiospora hydei]|uniref:Mitochondrial export translocase protein n=1 Tax=Apiospora hydei TaxID=1337664 RepID=A0ABR1XEI5_9PEZI
MSLHLHRHFAQATTSSALLKRSFIIHPHSNSSFKRLQPHLQQKQQHGSQRRTLFTESVQAAVQGSQALILGAHAATGLPWAAVIPLIAVSVNAVFRLPFSAYSQKLLQRRKRVEPLLQAWRERVIKDVVVRERTDPAKAKAKVEDRLKTIQRRVYSALGLRQWRFYLSLTSFPVWLLALDGIRRVCGGQKGVLLGLLTGEKSLEAGSAAGQAGADASSAAAVATPTTGGPVAQSISAAVDTTIPEITSAASTAVGPTTSAVDPSLATEGMLWFTDLTVADPYHILPVALVGMLMLNLIPKNQAARSAILGSGLYRGVIYVMPLGTFVLMDMPAALHLYWLSSAAAHFVFGQILNRMMPLDQKPIEKCKGISSMVISPKSKPGQKDWEKLF